MNRESPVIYSPYYQEVKGKIANQANKIPATARSATQLNTSLVDTNTHIFNNESRIILIRSFISILLFIYIY
jgi:hypothetical protein